MKKRTTKVPPIKKAGKWMRLASASDAGPGPRAPRPGKTRGQPRHRDSPEQAGRVLQAARCGLTDEQIASIEGCSEPTLRKYYGDKLTQARAEGKGLIAKGIMQAALSGNVTALIFLSKTRLHWRENDPTASVAVTVNGAGPSDDERRAMFDAINRKYRLPDKALERELMAEYEDVGKVE